MKAFEDLKVATATYMAYTNINLNLKDIFSCTPITFVNPPLTKKKKNIDKKKIECPYGQIISLQYNLYVRGLRMSDEKKYWCPKCQLIDKDKTSKFEKQIKTVNEVIKPLSKEELISSKFPAQTKKIHLICSTCGTEFNMNDIKHIVPFLNQVTIVLSLGDILINIMVFKDNLKLAGNKSLENAMESVMILWEDYIRDVPSRWNYREGFSKNEVKFLFSLSMKNLNFDLGFPIDRYKLNKLMNNPEYRSKIHLSKYESTSDTNVNIKMRAIKPKEHKYDMLTYNNDCNTCVRSQTSELLFSKGKKKKDEFITFIVFSSAQTNLSGRYHEVMKEYYNFFINTTKKHRKQIEENIEEPANKINL